MSFWNHRVVRKTFFKDTEKEEEQYSIREVFYNDDESISAYTSEPIDLACESLEALREYIGWCLKALDKPFLVDGEVEFKDNYEPKISESFDTIDETFDWLNKWEDEGGNGNHVLGE